MNKRDFMISTKEFNELIEGATYEDLKHLITAGINETILMTNNQLLKLVELKKKVKQ